MLDRLKRSWSRPALIGAAIGCALLASVTFYLMRSVSGGHSLSPTAHASNLEPPTHTARQTLVSEQLSFLAGKDHEVVAFWAKLLATGADRVVTLCVLLPGGDNDVATAAYVSDNYDIIMEQLRAAASQAQSALPDAASLQADGLVALISKIPVDPADQAFVQRMFQARGLAADVRSSAF